MPFLFIYLFYFILFFFIFIFIYLFFFFFDNRELKDRCCVISETPFKQSITRILFVEMVYSQIVANYCTFLNYMCNVAAVDNGNGHGVRDWTGDMLVFHCCVTAD